jgi:Protein of unknown function (DUF3551)
MRIVLTTAVLIVLGATADRAAADPYRWCAEYGVGGDGGTNCYFVTLEQCQAAVSGVGGICRPNGFYDGRPVTAPEQPVRRTRRHS